MQPNRRISTKSLEYRQPRREHEQETEHREGADAKSRSELAEAAVTRPTPEAREHQRRLAVLDVETGGHGGPSGHGGPGGGSGEVSLTGSVASQAKAAAVAKVGGSADRASTENDSSNAASRLRGARH